MEIVQGHVHVQHVVIDEIGQLGFTQVARDIRYDEDNKVNHLLRDRRVSVGVSRLLAATVGASVRARSERAGVEDGAVMCGFSGTGVMGVESRI